MSALDGSNRGVHALGAPSRAGKQDVFAGGGPDGIRVNVVAPLVRSRVMEETFPTRESIEALRVALSLRRPAEPRDVGRMVAFLVSGNAAFNRPALQVDGGSSYNR